jgi:hypothetical protein
MEVGLNISASSIVYYRSRCSRRGLPRRGPTAPRPSSGWSRLPRPSLGRRPSLLEAHNRLTSPGLSLDLCCQDSLRFKI